MTDPLKPGENVDKGYFKPGYDPRRWLKGRPKKPKDKKAAEDLLEHVIWEELSRMIENKDSGESVDALRLMIRSMIRNKATQDKILDRIAGKVKDEVEHSGGVTWRQIIDDANSKPDNKQSE